MNYGLGSRAGLDVGGLLRQLAFVSSGIVFHGDWCVPEQCGTRGQVVAWPVGKAGMIGVSGSGEVDYGIGEIGGEGLGFSGRVGSVGRDRGGGEGEVVEGEGDVDGMRRAPFATVGGRLPDEVVDPGGAVLRGSALAFDDHAVPGAEAGSDGEENVGG